MTKWVIGIDEAGRGPLAGPVSVGVVMVANNFDWSCLPPVGDSKQMSPKDREAVFRAATILRQSGQLEWRVAMVGAKHIDSKGIVPSVCLAMSRALKKVVGEMSVNQVRVKLDGGLKAPVEFFNQETIIRGDGKEKVIGLASVLAKVTRDRHMVRLSQRDSLVPYDFATHKGYGTKHHRAMIQQHGLSSIHRQTFCWNLLK